MDEEEGRVRRRAAVLERLEAKAIRKLDKGLPRGHASKSARKGGWSADQLDLANMGDIDSDGDDDCRSDDSDDDLKDLAAAGSMAKGRGKKRTDYDNGSLQKKDHASATWDGRPVFGERLVVDGDVVASTALGEASEAAMRREVERIGLPMGERARLRTMVANLAKPKRRQPVRRLGIDARLQLGGVTSADLLDGSPPSPLKGEAAQSSDDGMFANDYIPRAGEDPSSTPKLGPEEQVLVSSVLGRPAGAALEGFERAMAEEDAQIRRLVGAASGAKRDAAMMEQLLARDDAYELPAGRDPQAMLAFVRPHKVKARLLVPAGHTKVGQSK